MILWGYSFSGAHVLTLASKKKYRAVIANFPHVDGIASLAGYPIHYMIPATCLAITDIIYNLFGKVKNIKVVAKNRFAVLSGNDCYNGYYSLIPQNQNWDNQVPARILAMIALYRPITVAHKIESPTLIIGAIKDSLIPISKTRATANKSSYIQYAEYNCGHFDLFHEPFMTRIKTQHQKFLENISNLENMVILAPSFRQSVKDVKASYKVILFNSATINIIRLIRSVFIRILNVCLGCKF